MVAEYKKLQLQTVQTENKTVFIPDRAHQEPPLHISTESMHLSEAFSNNFFVR
jgi:hypothetical protein